MIRTAKFADIPRLMELQAEAYAKSKYLGLSGLDYQESKKFFMGSIQCNQVRGPGGSCVFVAEMNGRVEGVIVGIVDRIYAVGTNYVATDRIFYVTPAAGIRAFVKLFDAFEQWAESNPRVVLIQPTISDAIMDDPDRLGKFYERRGYKMAVAAFERVVTK